MLHYTDLLVIIVICSQTDTLEVAAVGYIDEDSQAILTRTLLLRKTTVGVQRNATVFVTESKEEASQGRNVQMMTYAFDDILLVLKVGK